MPADTPAQEAPMTDPIKLARDALEPFCFFDEDQPDIQSAWEMRYRDRFQDWISFEDIEAARTALAALDAVPQPAPVPGDAELDALQVALRRGRQADMEGVMVTVSRQACEYAADALSALRTRLAEVEGAMPADGRDPLILRGAKLYGHCVCPSPRGHQGDEGATP